MDTPTLNEFGKVKMFEKKLIFLIFRTDFVEDGDFFRSEMKKKNKQDQLAGIFQPKKTRRFSLNPS